MTEYVLYLGIHVLLTVPLGGYIGKVMNGERVFLSKLAEPVEGLVYRILQVNLMLDGILK